MPLPLVLVLVFLQGTSMLSATSVILLRMRRAFFCARMRIQIFTFLATSGQAMSPIVDTSYTIRKSISPPRSHLAPLGFPRAIPLPLPPLTLFPRAAPPLAPLADTSPTPRLLSPELGRTMGAGVANLVVAREDGGLSTKEVSVVMNVSSPKSGRELWSVAGSRSSFCFARLKDSGIGAWQSPLALNYVSWGSSYTSGKSTQNAFMFIPYKKLAKLSLNRLRLSCINCKCIKLASKSAIESESSAKAGSNDINGKAEAPDLGVNVWLSRKEVRELGRRGVEGCEGGLVRVAEVERFEFGRSMTANSIEQA